MPFKTETGRKAGFRHNGFKTGNDDKGFQRRLKFFLLLPGCLDNGFFLNVVGLFHADFLPGSVVHKWGTVRLKCQQQYQREHP
ncbi:MAG: hypothetical protein IKH24_09545 [Bacteroidales bacterium]|nr:hypothetical protein [Bacteroidales bacterium]